MPPVIKSKDHFAETCIDDEIVLMNVDTGRFHALKATGRDIWALIDDARDAAAISAQLQRRYKVSPTECDAEVLRFIGDLRTAGFLVA